MPTDDELISQHMRQLARARWKKKPKRERAAEQRARIVAQYRRDAKAKKE